MLGEGKELSSWLENIRGKQATGRETARAMALFREEWALLAIVWCGKVIVNHLPPILLDRAAASIPFT